MQNNINLPFNSITELKEYQDTFELDEKINQIKFPKEMKELDNQEEVIKNVLNKDLNWIGYCVQYVMKSRTYIETYINISGFPFTTLKLGSSEEIISFLRETETNIIKGRKHFWQEEYDISPYLVIYQPKPFKKFLEETVELYKNLVKNDAHNNKIFCFANILLTLFETC